MGLTGGQFKATGHSLVSTQACIFREFVSHNSRPQFGSLNHAYLGVRKGRIAGLRWPDSGHAAGMSKMTRMTQSRRWMFGRIFGLDGCESYRELRL
jgi:hypothetical protein